MTGEARLIDGRYRLGRRERALDAVERFAATDDRLGRPVTLWIAEAGTPEEDALLEVARVVAERPQRVFLRILDVVSAEDHVTVILEAAGGPLARVSRTPLDAPAAILALTEGVEEVMGEGLVLTRLAIEDLSIEADGDVRADPIALFLRPDAEAPLTSAAILLGDAIEALLARSSTEPAVADRLRRLAEDWRAGDVEATSATVRDAVRITGSPAPSEATHASDARATALYIDDEPTLVFTPTFAASAGAAAVASPPRRGGQRARQRATVEATPVVTTSRRIAARPAAPARPGERGALPWRVFIPVAAMLGALLVGTVLFALRQPVPTVPASGPSTAASVTTPPVNAPASGHVTVGLVARQDSGVRVTVDGVVQFDGTLKSGQRQAWDGKQRVDIWTDTGKTLGLAVNGKDLGPYSPAMGHADWNRIDFSFWPGWPQ